MSTAGLVASIRQRLLNLSRQRKENFQLVLTHYFIERFLYRLSRSTYAEQFVLKGAMLFRLWGGQTYRPTRDLDLLGFGDASPESLKEVIQAVCDASVEPDGLRFDSQSIRITEIRELQKYLGRRVQLAGYLGKARLLLQVDIAFGDVVSPSVQEVEYPTLLEMPSPRLRVYSQESFVAEKLESIVQLGMVNSRMKDFYDLWVLSRVFEFEGQRLVEAVRATFARRQTQLPQNTPAALSREFAMHSEKISMWRAFVRRNGLETGDVMFLEVIQALKRFLLPVLTAASRGIVFEGHWTGGGPWMEREDFQKRK